MFDCLLRIAGSEVSADGEAAAGGDGSLKIKKVQNSRPGKWESK